MAVRSTISGGLISISADEGQFEGELSLPQPAEGIVLFSHGSGSSRLSPRNRYVAHVLNQAGFGTLLMDLLTQEEAELDEVTTEFRFDIPLLARRLMKSLDWIHQNLKVSGTKVGLFGASTGAASALIAAAARPSQVGAVVSRGGRPDLAEAALSKVQTPTLLIVGGLDFGVSTLNQKALERMSGVRDLVTISGATHLFEEPGALEEVARISTSWFKKYLLEQTESYISTA